MGSISTHSRELAALLIFTVAFLALNFRETEAMNISSGRKLLQTNNVSDTSNQSDDTVRRDPLDHLRKYRGGFNVQNKHYWSSTIFTGIYGYAIGAFFLLCGIAYGGFLLITNSCHKNIKNRRRKRRPPCDKQCSLGPILLAACFTILAITASGVVLGGGSRFYSRAKTVMNIIIDTAGEASETIYETTRAMQEINKNLQASNQGTDTSSFLTSSSQELNSQASNIEKQARKNRRRIQNGLKIVYVVTTVTISINLIALIALSVSGFLKLRRTHYWLTGLCWLMTVLCWLFFGAYFFLGGFAGDVCTAFNNFQQNPYNNTLSSILPCDDLLSAGPVLSDASERIYNLVNEVNENISGIQATLSSNRVQVCNPFSGPPDYQYQPGNCPTNTIKIGDIPEVLKAFTCSGNNNRTCQGGEFISANDYRTVESYSNSLQNLLNVYPKMESLLQCQVVKDAFSEILHRHCGPLKRYDRMVWIALIFLSVMMVKLVLIWVTRHHHEKKCHFSDGSVKPDSTTENTMDLRQTKATTNSSNPIQVM